MSKKTSATDATKNQGGCSLIQLEPRHHHHSISQGRTVLTTSLDGSMRAEGDQGLWVYQTRMLSCYQWSVNGNAPTFSALSAIEQHRDLAYYIFAPPECEHKGNKCDPAQQAVELLIERTVGEGLLETLILTNHTQIKTRFVLQLQVSADFADPSEAHGTRQQKGHISVLWNEKTPDRLLSFDYKTKHRYRHQGDSGTASLHRGVYLGIAHDQPQPKHRKNTIRFHLILKPKEVWRATLRWTAQLEGKDLPLWGTEGELRRQRFFMSSASYSSTQERDLTNIVLRTLHQSAGDLSDLRLFDLDGRDAIGPTWIPAAGLPLYCGFFGRDTLFSGRAAASLSTEIMRGSLMQLAIHLGKSIDDWRDEQPGRMIHELHTSPLAVLNYTPHGRYFGTTTCSFFYPSLVADLWRWTGKKDLVEPLIEPALRGLRWADRFSRDESGFYKYRTRSKQGEKNQGWKDSGDAIVHADGSQVVDPLGTCEMQSYIYNSKIGLAEILDRFGEVAEARRLKAEAIEFKKRFNDFFWMPDEGYLAMGIDSKNKPIRSIASDPGHCLLNGIVDDSLKKAVVKRLMKDDMFSGWGVRTLSSEHPAFNPFSYHRGSVWPVENAMFVLALARCGLYDDMSRLAKAIFESAALFEYCRLPELFAGHQRDSEHAFPGLYPKANSPQAWSASAPFQIMQAMLGIQPDAPNETIFVDPHLPAWLPEIHVSDLTIGDAVIDVRFFRDECGVTSFELLNQQQNLRVVRRSGFDTST